ncbi:hypothetical protein MNB_SV-3-1464 [hydrothermal vent metagenome]|uniref:Phosphate-specific outer membrane porin OprP Pyrophosphate-specific outer membrane porin OprO n=1 Tax=hydrothermal vent metagenome TaxID=652676 RepID=A0A1W1C0P2_9ZZZZ
MKNTILSLITISAISTTGVLADSTTDIAELKMMMQQMSKRLAKLEAENKQLKRKTVYLLNKKHRKHRNSSVEKRKNVASEEKLQNHTTVKSKAPVLKFSGTHYLGFVSDKVGATDGTRINKFETRRNYLQVKAYFAQNPKDYLRVTLDTDQKDNGDWSVRVKYAYLYLDNVLPFTGVELGQAHRPWMDYEEHHGWRYRSVSKTFIEGTPDLVNSSDLGFNFKTKTDYFSSELGLFNGSGYHGIKDGNGLSAEWRLTGHILGTGRKHVHKSTQYADISFFGQYGTNGIKNSDPVSGDYKWYGVHAVYNQEAFLIACQYLKASEAKASKKGKGWSVNGEIRPLKDVSFFAKYDDFKLDSGTKKKRTTVGIGYEYNKNIEFVVNYDKKEVDDATTRDALMLSAEVKW